MLRCLLPVVAAAATLTMPMQSVASAAPAQGIHAPVDSPGAVEYIARIDTPSAERKDDDLSLLLAVGTGFVVTAGGTAYRTRRRRRDR